MSNAEDASRAPQHAQEQDAARRARAALRLQVATALLAPSYAEWARSEGPQVETLIRRAFASADMIIAESDASFAGHGVGSRD